MKILIEYILDVPSKTYISCHSFQGTDLRRKTVLALATYSCSIFHAMLCLCSINAEEEGSVPSVHNVNHVEEVIHVHVACPIFKTFKRISIKCDIEM
jgi:hypothetical protein